MSRRIVSSINLPTVKQTIAQALRRVVAVLERRPDLGLHDDALAVARWQAGLRVVTSHVNGTEVVSDMPLELGGSGDLLTPGWLFRAGLASCLTTCIAMAAASQDIELKLLEVTAVSRSDTRGLLGLPGADGLPACAAPQNLRVCVRISAAGVGAARLRELVKNAQRCSPVPNAVLHALPLALDVDVA